MGKTETVLAKRQEALEVKRREVKYYVNFTSFVSAKSVLDQALARDSHD